MKYHHRKGINRNRENIILTIYFAIVIFVVLNINTLIEWAIRLSA